MSSLLVSDADSSRRCSRASRLLRASRALCAPARRPRRLRRRRSRSRSRRGPGRRPDVGSSIETKPISWPSFDADRDQELVVLLPAVRVVRAVVPRDDRADAAEVRLVDRAGRDEVGAAEVEGRIEERLDGGARHLAPLQRVDDLRRRMDGHDLEVVPRRPVEVDGDGPHVEHPRQLLDDLLQGTREILVQGARLDLDQAAQGAQDGARLDRHDRQCPIPGPAATRGPEVLWTPVAALRVALLADGLDDRVGLQVRETRSSVHDEVLAREVGGRVRAQEGDHPGHLLGASDALERCPRLGDGREVRRRR